MATVTARGEGWPRAGLMSDGVFVASDCLLTAALRIVIDGDSVCFYTKGREAAVVTASGGLCVCCVVRAEAR